MHSFTWGSDSKGRECGERHPDPPDYKTIALQSLEEQSRPWCETGVRFKAEIHRLASDSFFIKLTFNTKLSRANLMRCYL